MATNDIKWERHNNSVAHYIKCDQCNNRIDVRRSEIVVITKGRYNALLNQGSSKNELIASLEARIQKMQDQESRWHQALEHFG